MPETLLKIWPADQNTYTQKSRLPFFSSRKVTQRLYTQNIEVMHTICGTTLPSHVKPTYEMILSFQDEIPPAFSRQHIGAFFIIDSLISFTEILDEGSQKCTLDRTPVAGSITYQTPAGKKKINHLESNSNKTCTILLPEPAKTQSFLRYRPRFTMILTKIDATFDERQVRQQWDLHWSEKLGS